MPAQNYERYVCFERLERLQYMLVMKAWAFTHQSAVSPLAMLAQNSERYVCFERLERLQYMLVMKARAFNPFSQLFRLS